LLASNETHPASFVDLHKPFLLPDPYLVVGHAKNVFNLKHAYIYRSGRCHVAVSFPTLGAVFVGQFNKSLRTSLLVMIRSFIMRSKAGAFSQANPHDIAHGPHSRPAAPARPNLAREIQIWLAQM
jgi:hypothetical protein